MIINEEDTADIVVDCGGNDFVLTNAIVDPATKGNIETYVLKDNIPVSFHFANVDVESKTAMLRTYYYRTVKNKNVIIRCLDKVYTNGEEMNVVPIGTFQILKATNRLDGCLFIYDFTYKVKNEEEPRRAKIAFKIVPEKEYYMYESIEVAKKLEEENAKEIKRPKKIEEKYDEKIDRPKKHD